MSDARMQSPLSFLTVPSAHMSACTDAALFSSTATALASPCDHRFLTVSSLPISPVPGTLPLSNAAAPLAVVVSPHTSEGMKFTSSNRNGSGSGNGNASGSASGPVHSSADGNVLLAPMPKRMNQFPFLSGEDAAAGAMSHTHTHSHSPAHAHVQPHPARLAQSPMAMSHTPPRFPSVSPTVGRSAAATTAGHMQLTHAQLMLPEAEMMQPRELSEQSNFTIMKSDSEGRQVLLTQAQMAEHSADDQQQHPTPVVGTIVPAPVPVTIAAGAAVSTFTAFPLSSSHTTLTRTQLSRATSVDAAKGRANRGKKKPQMKRSNTGEDEAMTSAEEGSASSGGSRGNSRNTSAAPSPASRKRRVDANAAVPSRAVKAAFGSQRTRVNEVGEGEEDESMNDVADTASAGNNIHSNAPSRFATPASAIASFASASVNGSCASSLSAATPSSRAQSASSSLSSFSSRCVSPTACAQMSESGNLSSGLDAAFSRLQTVESSVSGTAMKSGASEVQEQQGDSDLDDSPHRGTAAKSAVAATSRALRPRRAAATTTVTSSAVAAAAAAANASSAVLLPASASSTRTTSGASAASAASFVSSADSGAAADGGGVASAISSSSTVKFSIQCGNGTSQFEYNGCVILWRKASQKKPQHALVPTYIYLHPRDLSVTSITLEIDNHRIVVPRASIVNPKNRRYSNFVLRDKEQDELFAAVQGCSPADIREFTCTEAGGSRSGVGKSKRKPDCIVSGVKLHKMTLIVRDQRIPFYYSSQKRITIEKAFLRGPSAVSVTAATVCNCGGQCLRCALEQLQEKLRIFLQPIAAAGDGTVVPAAAAAAAAAAATSDDPDPSCYSSLPPALQYSSMLASIEDMRRSFVSHRATLLGRYGISARSNSRPTSPTRQSPKSNKRRGSGSSASAAAGGGRGRKRSAAQSSDSEYVEGDD